jgi:hypothetical protein
MEYENDRKRMSTSLSRRDFLKLGGLVPLGLAGPGLVRGLSRQAAQAGTRQNVLVIVFDAFSAYNISLYGYRRETMPNLARWRSGQSYITTIPPAATSPHLVRPRY